MNFNTLWERHKNPISWLARPIFGALMFYGAWDNNALTIIIGLIGISTSWFWFPKPKRTYKWADKFIDIEKKYVTPPWTYRKVIPLVLTIILLTVVMIALWRHDAKLGLAIFIGGAVYKAIWSLQVAKKAGIPAAIIGVVSAIIGAIVLYWLL